MKYRWALDGTTLADLPRAFYTLSAAALTSGSHNLKVTAYNSVSSAVYTFPITKNSPPTLSSPTPSVTGGSVTCGAGTMHLTTAANDLEGANLTYVWKVNGVSGSPFFTSIVSSNTGSSSDFTPNCTLTGTITLSVEVSDGYDTTVMSPAWSVSIINSGVVNIDSITPNTSPSVIIPSTSSKTFTMVNVTGLAPLSYAWSIDGTPIPGEISTAINLFASTLDPLAGLGPYTLTAKVTDGTTNNDTASVQVVLNKPPVLSGQSPSATTITKSYTSPNLTFTVTGSDLNSDAIRYTWTIDGVIYDTPYSGLPSHISINGASPNTMIFDPDVALLGNHTISVRAREDRATDFEYSNTISWNLALNRYSNDCNGLQAGQICTLVGMPGLGEDVNANGRFDAGTDKIKIRPNQIFAHAVQNIDTSAIDNLFISDTANHIIWYFNRSNKPQSVLGLTVQANEVKALLGNGASGKTPDDNATYAYTAYKLSYPETMWYDPTNDFLYIADRGNQRVVRINNSGQGKRVFGTEAIVNNAGTNTTGAAATSHVCSAPAGILVNSAKTKMYVSCANSHSIKEISLVTYSDPSTWTAKVLIGVPAAAPAASNAEGAFPATAGLNMPWAMVFDPNENIIFSQVNSCRIRVANLNTGGGLTLFTVATAINNVSTIVGDGNCGWHGTLSPATSSRIGFPKGLLAHIESSTFKGLFIGTTDVHRLVYANHDASSRSFGGVSVATNSINSIWGSGTGTYSGNSKPGISNTVFNPTGIIYSGNNIILAEPSNNRVRTIEIYGANATDGNISTLLHGIEAKHDSSPDAPGVDAPNFRGYFLSSIMHDSTNNSLLFSDTGSSGMWHPTHQTPQNKTIDNNRIRKLDLSTGLVSTFAGQGYGTFLNQQSPLNVFFHGIRSIVPMGDNLLLLDRHWGQGGSRNCNILMYNRASATGNYFNSNVDSGMIGILGGNYTQGCNTESGLGAVATASRIEPFAIAYAPDPADAVYMTQFRRHCILKINSAGIISSSAGLCGTAGNVDGTLTNARFSFPLSIVQDPRNPTNVYVMDQTSSLSSSIKYINYSSAEVDIGGVQIPAGEVKQLFSVTDGYGIGIGLYKDSVSATNDRICYTSGSGINSTVSGSAEMGDGQLGYHRVTCHLLQTLSKEMVIGSDVSTIRGGSQILKEHEGLSYEAGAIKKIKVLLYTPYGLAFDSSGNLYITERDSHVIRKVTKWW